MLQSVHFLYCSVFAWSRLLSLIDTAMMGVILRFNQRSHFLSDSTSFYTKYNTHATTHMSNKLSQDIEYYMRLAGHASLVLWVFIFTLRLSELKIHGLRIRIRGAVVQKTADLSR